MYLQTKGYVLKYRNWREGDRIYTIYTQKLGKLEIQARGTRKPQSKLAGQLRPFTPIDFSLAKGKVRYQLIGAVKNIMVGQSNHDSTTLRHAPSNSVGRQGDNMRGMAYGYYFLELVDELTREGQRNDEAFGLLGEALAILFQLEHLEHLEQLEQLKQLRVAFLLKVLKATGFNPEERVKRGDNIQGILEQYIHHPLDDIINIDLNGDPEKADESSSHGARIKQLFNISQYTLNEVIDKQLKTVKFLQSLS